MITLGNLVKFDKLQWYQMSFLKKRVDKALKIPAILMCSSLMMRRLHGLMNTSICVQTCKWPRGMELFTQFCSRSISHTLFIQAMANLQEN